MESIKQLDFFREQMTKSFAVAYQGAGLCATMMNTVENFFEAVKEDVLKLEAQISELTQDKAALEAQISELTQDKE